MRKSIYCSVVVCVLTAAASAQTTWHVDASAGPSGDGTSWETPFQDLQSALAVAQSGDEIWVVAGIYIPSQTGDAESSFFLVNGVGLYGGFVGSETQRDQRDWHANQTILSGDVGQDDVVGSGSYWYVNWNIHTPNCGHVVVGSGTDASTIIDGFTIENGHTGPTGTPAGDPLMFGSGIYNIAGSPTIRNCTLRHNLAGFAAGGAIYNYNSNPAITNCRIVENYVHLGDGGGICNAGTSAPVIEDCFFQYNIGIAASGEASGGGVAHWSSVPITVRRCTFDANTVKPFYTVGSDIGYGGGLWCFNSGITVEDCIFTDNYANLGGGFWSWGNATLVNCLFEGNRAVPQPNDPWPEGGGEGAALGLYLLQGETAELINATVVNNEGKKHAVVINGNGNLLIHNSILWDNTGWHADVVGGWREELGGSFDAAYSCIRYIFDPAEPGDDPIDPADLPGCIDVDPLFVNQTNGADLHLAPGSPCIDAADNTLVPFGITTDLDGLSRFVDDPDTNDTGNGAAPIVDMGAYEVQNASVPGDLDGDGDVDQSDLGVLLSCYGVSDCGDTDGDGDTDQSDLGVLLANYGFGI